VPLPEFEHSEICWDQPEAMLGHAGM
jgi:hypothetical protein